jgi:outer membrane protein assembly factor BamA
VRGGLIDPRGDDDEIPPDQLAEAVPTNDRFRTGGVNSVRGYNEDKIAPLRGTPEQPQSGGLVLLQANVELRIPLIGPFGIEVYLDAGNVWLRSKFMTWDDFVPSWSHEPLDENDVRYVIGIGPRVNLPIGPLRLDVTWGFRPIQDDPSIISTSRDPKVQFAIGPSF